MLEVVPQPIGKTNEELDPKEELQNSIASHKGIIIQSIVETVCKPEFILKVNLCLYNGSEIFFNWDGVTIYLQKQPEETQIKCEVSEIAVTLHDLIAESQDILTFQEAVFFFPYNYIFYRSLKIFFHSSKQKRFYY